MAVSARELARRGAWASACLDRIKATDRQAPPTDREIADIAGVDRTVVSHWRDGTDVLYPWHLAALAEAWGAEVVLGRTARPVAGNPLSTMVELGARVADAQRVIVDAMSDGDFDAFERAATLARLDDAAQVLAELRGQVARHG